MYQCAKLHHTLDKPWRFTRFLLFKMTAIHHLGIFKIFKFCWLIEYGSPRCIALANFTTTARMVADVSWLFFRMVANSGNCNGWLHAAVAGALPCQTSSKDCRDMVILKIAAVRHLWFSNSGNFNGWLGAEGPDVSPCKIMSKLDSMFA